jgi:hypothetical protein
MIQLSREHRFPLIDFPPETDCVRYASPSITSVIIEGAAQNFSTGRNVNVATHEAGTPLTPCCQRRKDAAMATIDSSNLDSFNTSNLPLAIKLRFCSLVT